MREDESAFIYVEVNAKEYELVILKLRLGAVNIDRNCELAGAKICVCDNDTSGVIRSNKKRRCKTDVGGVMSQPLVCTFFNKRSPGLSYDESAVAAALSSADKPIIIERGTALWADILIFLIWKIRQVGRRDSSVIRRVLFYMK